MTQRSLSTLEQHAKEYLKKALLSTVEIDDTSIHSLLDLFEMVTCKKNQIIINEGEIADYFYFIYKGIVRVYYYKSDKIVIERFEKEGGFFGGNFTHLTKKPGVYIYESVEDAQLLKIKYTDLEELCNKSHQVERLYRVNMELFHVNYVHHLSLYKSLNTEERYAEFINNYGDVANRVSLKDVANYLEMTPETLSRIRAKFDKINKAK
jgi:CRP-like cAMP-binding protein